MRFIPCLCVVSLLLLIGSRTGCKKTPPKAPPVEEAKVEPKKEAPKEEPKKVEEKPDPKAPKKRQGIVMNVRMAAMRPQTQNDMKQIGLFYKLEADLGNAPTTVEAFKKAIQRDAPKIVEKIDKGDFIINLKGKKLQPNDILAYEYEAGSEAGFCVVRANGAVETALPYEQLKQELGLK
jgi:hypothetical protein